MFIPAALSGVDPNPMENFVMTEDSNENVAVVCIQSADTQWEAGILPGAGGRLVFLRESGGENFLKSDPGTWNPSEFVKPSAGSGFKEFNGHIVWLSPQVEWWSQQDVAPEKRGDNWPPDPYLIYGTYAVKERTSSHIRLCGPESPISGVRLCKTYTFTEPRTFCLKTTLTNVRDGPVAWGLWSNTRLDPGIPFYAAIEGMPAKAAWYDDPEGVRGTFLSHGSWFTFGDVLSEGSPGREISNKVYLPTQLAWMGAFFGKWLLVKEMPAVERDRVHPLQAPVEVYIRTGGDPARRLLELEFHGPYTELAPGQSISLKETWTLYEAQGAEDEEARLTLLEKLRPPP